MNRFFLSYARGDDDEYVQRFYLDLCREIRVCEGLPRGERVGFMDTASIRVGAKWPNELVAALKECGVFLPLYAPGYFLSESCGREWAAFEHRLRQHHGTPETAGSFIPVIWLQPSLLPEAAESLQYSSSAFGSAYAEYGLRQLIRLRRHEDDYRETVTAFAAEIARIANHCVIHPQGMDLTFTDLASAFDRGNPRSPFWSAQRTNDPAPPPDSTDAMTESGPEPPTGASDADGPKHVHFVIASTGRDEMKAVRSSLLCYGSTAQHWAPYRPQMPDPLGPYACEIAAGQQLRAELAGLDDLSDQIDRANGRNQILVLLVDPWISKIAGYGETLLAYDRRNEPTVPVLITVSDQDPETCKHREALSRTVTEAFPNNSLRSDPIFRPDVRTPEQFATELDQALQIALNRLMRRGTVFRTPPQPAAAPRAVLEGPDSLSNRRSL